MSSNGFFKPIKVCPARLPLLAYIVIQWSLAILALELAPISAKLSQFLCSIAGVSTMFGVWRDVFRTKHWRFKLTSAGEWRVIDQYGIAHSAELRRDRSWWSRRMIGLTLRSAHLKTVRIWLFASSTSAPVWRLLQVRLRFP